MICLDSDCAIDFLRNKQEAVEAVKRWREQLVTTEITRFQVFFGIYDKPQVSERETESARGLFSQLEVLPFDEGCGEHAAKLIADLIRLGSVIDETDCFIAASMKVHGCERILTGNEKHFSRIPGLEVVGY